MMQQHKQQELVHFDGEDDSKYGNVNHHGNETQKQRQRINAKD
jgi:hypothetical protein